MAILRRIAFSITRTKLLHYYLLFPLPAAGEYHIKHTSFVT
jgi:hypothetical protein